MKLPHHTITFNNSETIFHRYYHTPSAYQTKSLVLLLIKVATLSLCISARGKKISDAGLSFFLVQVSQREL